VDRWFATIASGWFYYLYRIPIARSAACSGSRPALWVRRRKVQLRHIMAVGNLHGETAPGNRAILTAEVPSAALHQHEAGDGVTAMARITRRIESQLQGQHELMGPTRCPRQRRPFSYLDEQAKCTATGRTPGQTNLRDILGPR